MKKAHEKIHYKYVNGIYKKYKLIKPLIYSQCHYNEWPFAYINRLSIINGYTKINWLVQDNLGYFFKNKVSYLLAYQLTNRSNWSIPNARLNVIRTLSANIKFINTLTLRVCPQCLHHSSYIRYEWVFLFSSVCLEHDALLHDICPDCYNPLDYQNIYFNRCECGKKITEFPKYPANKQCVLLQKIIENKKQCHVKISKLNYIDTLDLVYFFFIIIRRKCIKSNSSSTINMSDNIKIIETIVKALLCGKDGFWCFLNRFIHSVDSYSKNLIPFYRQFNRHFKHTHFSEYKRYLDDFINLYWRNHTTDKNTLFSKSILANHAWLSISKVKNQFNLSESLIIKAVIKGFIKTETIYCNDRLNQYNKPLYYHLYYQPDIIKYLHVLQDTISFKTVCLLLGTTKKQLNTLIKNNHFTFTIAPEDSYLSLEDKYNTLTHIIEKYKRIIGDSVSKGNSWLFLKSEIEAYLNNILKLATYAVKPNDSLTLPEAMRVIGNRIKEAYNQIITAIINQELPIFITTNEKLTLRDIYIPTKLLIDWINKKKQKYVYMTIPQMAEYLSISQQFAYELVNYQLMPYTIIEGNNTRWITKGNINTFNNNYVILSKLAKEKGISSKQLAAKLENMPDVYQKLTQGLKQVVYKKTSYTYISHFAIL